MQSKVQPSLCTVRAVAHRLLLSASERRPALAGYATRVTSKSEKLDARGRITERPSAQCLDALDGRPGGGFAANVDNS